MFYRIDYTGKLLDQILGKRFKIRRQSGSDKNLGFLKKLKMFKKNVNVGVLQ